MTDAGISRLQWRVYTPRGERIAAFLTPHYALGFAQCCPAGTTVRVRRQVMWTYDGGHAMTERRMHELIATLMVERAQLVKRRIPAVLIDPRQVLVAGLCKHCLKHRQHCSPNHPCCGDCTHRARKLVAVKND